jgi:hypothetical protein
MEFLRFRVCTFFGGPTASHAMPDEIETLKTAPAPGRGAQGPIVTKTTPSTTHRQSTKSP